jgi:hypothetical protein
VTASTETQVFHLKYLGGSFMMYPGDDSGPPEEVIGCRCSMLLET